MKRTSYGLRPQVDRIVQEFIEFTIAKPCTPSNVEVYETSCPGALVKISAKSPTTNNWVILWSGDITRDTAAKQARIFSPVLLTEVEFETSEFRLDMDVAALGSWYEIEAVNVTGSVVEQAAPPFERPQPTTLAGDMLALFQSQTGDVTFVTPTGEAVKAHSPIVLARCPTLLKSRSDPIHVADHPAVLKTVLHYVYSDTADVTAGTSVAVFVASKKYGLDKLASLALARFNGGLTHDNVFAALRLVNHVPELRHACLKYVATHPSLLSVGGEGSTGVGALTREQLAELVTIFAAGKAV